MPNLLVNAGPGTGKTHTIVDAYNYYRNLAKDKWQSRFNATDEQMAIYDWVYANAPSGLKTAAYMAYNKDIVKDIKKKAHPDCHVLTHHGWGYSIIRQKFGHVYLNKKKPHILVEKITGQPFFDLKNSYEWMASIKYVEKLKDELLNATWENLELLSRKYSDLGAWKIHDAMLEQVTKLIVTCKENEIIRRVGVDHVEQVFLALFLLTQPKYELGFVDECQDLSPARRELSLRLCRNLIFVGDRHQAINAWNGADPMSMSYISDHCDDERGLTLSFRLPPNHANNAMKIKKGAIIRTLSGKPDGLMESLDTEKIVEWAKERMSDNPLIICRYNAPLIKFSMQMIKEGIPVFSMGNSLSENLINIVEGRKTTDIDQLMVKLDQYERMCTQNGDDIAKEATRDRLDCIRTILRDCTSIQEFKSRVVALANPPKKGNYLELKTVHRAKGLERSTVAILNPPVPSARAETPIQIEQEENVNFVAHTRSKKDLFYVFTS